MTPTEYRAALTTLGLSQLAAGRWLGVSPKTAQRYAVDGPSGPAARAVGMAVALVGLERWEVYGGHHGDSDEHDTDPSGRYIRHSDLTDATAIPAKSEPAS